MSKKENDILQGTLTLLILKTLACGKRMHGYAITAYIQQVSAQLLRVEEGSCKTEKNRDARFYSLTARGRKQLMQKKESWKRLTEGVARVIRYA